MTTHIFLIFNGFTYFCKDMVRIDFLIRRMMLTFVMVLVTVSGLRAQMKWNSAYQAYIDQYKDIAIEQMLRYRIPASITLAQGLFESGAGRSELALKGNNHFGIKCHDWGGAAVYHDDDERGECFRAYRNAAESYEDHSRFLSGSQRYRRLFSLPLTDYQGWARGLKAAGYATNPRYADKLIEIIRLYHLYEYDHATRYDKFMARASADRPATAGGTLHPIKMCNDNYFLRARQGDTFKSIAKEVGISSRKLARYNERDRHEPLSAGDIIFLKKKRTRADRSFKNKPHVVVAGESMYSIAQKYGIRLKSLYKKNHLPADYQLEVGDRLRVY